MSILHQIPSESKIRRDLKKILFGKKLFCPRCGSYQIKKYANRYRCKRKKCRKPFSLTSVSWLRGTKLPLKTFWLLLWCYTNEVPIKQTKKLAGVSKVTTYRWFDKFREHIPREPLEAMYLEGVVQMDEAYRGGKKKGYAVVGAKENAKKGKERKFKLKMIDKSSVDRREVVQFLSMAVVPDSILRTDGASIYKGIENWWRLTHEYEVHSKGQFELTSEIEGLWGEYTTFVRRMYHHITRDKVPALLVEFTARRCFPQWFLNPESFLEKSLKPLEKPEKNRNEIFTKQTVFIPLLLGKKLNTAVPC